MDYINRPAKTLKNVTHSTFYSRTLDHEIGYNVYLPRDYFEGEALYPVVYHIHGWQGNESSELGSLEPAFRSRRAVTVFMNAISSKSEYFDALLQMEFILLQELIPHIEGRYRTGATRESRCCRAFRWAAQWHFTMRSSTRSGLAPWFRTREPTTICITRGRKRWVRRRKEPLNCMAT